MKKRGIALALVATMMLGIVSNIQFVAKAEENTEYVCSVDTFDETNDCLDEAFATETDATETDATETDISYEEVLDGVAGIPNPWDKATESNVLAVMQKYNPEVYNMLTTQLASGYRFMVWYEMDGPNTPIMEDLDTAVHETQHGYISSGGFAVKRINVGDGKEYKASYYDGLFGGKDIIKTENMAENIPVNLRTVRYDTYVGKGSRNDSNTKGMYGMMDEFNAYYWGMRMMTSMEQYLKDTNATSNEWEKYVGSLGNNMNAYAEFKYWMLSYMNYLQKNYPQKYQDVLDDTELCTAYAENEKAFSAMITNMKNNLPALNTYLATKNLIITCTDESIGLAEANGWGGYSYVDLEAYTMLQNEMKKTEYVQMDQILKANAGATPIPQPTPQPPKKEPIPEAPVKENAIAMYRLYNPNSGEHFYTASAKERDNLYTIGWNYEGIGWYAPISSNTPVYRLYNANGGEHHYTTSASERDTLVKIGWKYEGIGWYSDDACSVPLYRQYNPNELANNHNYSTSKSENDFLISIGWRYEGIGWYGVN